MMRCSFALGVVLCAGVLAHAQEKPSDSLLTVDHYLDYEQVADPQISPDGSQIVYTRRWVDKMTDKWESALWIVSPDGSRNRFLTKGNGARWSPDGTRLAYLADGEPKGPQVFVRWMDGSGVSQIARVDRAPSTLRWSPDGAWVGFTMLVKRESSWKIDLPAAPEGATWTPAPRYVDRLHFRQDGTGFQESGDVHLFIIPADGGTPRDLIHGDWSVGAMFDGLRNPTTWSWSPDGKTVVIDGLDDSTADHNYHDSNIYAIDVATGQVRSLTPERGDWSSPVLSPDGRTVAYVGVTHAQGEQAYHAAGLYVVKLDGGGTRLLSTGFDRDPAQVAWTSDGRGIYFSADDHGSANIYFLPAAGGEVKALTSGVQVLSLSSVAKNGTAAILRTTPQHPNDVYRIDLRRPADILQLTKVNDDVLGHIHLGQVEEVNFTSSGGTKVQGWIVKPPSFDAHKKYPLILSIHGGPIGTYRAEFGYAFQNFAANGFVVLYLNPRGSTGYGTEFSNAIYHQYPGPDYDDLMAGVDTLLGRGYIDAKNLFITGCSGGGVLTTWVIGHTTRFAAAGVRCPVIDWISMAGETDIPLFTYSWFAKPFWEDPSAWLTESPLMYVGKVTTPTLLMTGDLDMRTPMPQTEEYYVALKVRHVPTAMLRFANEYHGTASRPSNFMRTQLYLMSWFRKYGSGLQTTVAANAKK